VFPSFINGVTEGGNMAFCNKCGKSIAENHQFCATCKERMIESIRETEKEIKKNSRAHWIGIIGGGIIAGLFAMILRENGVSLGFLPTLLFWLAAYWIIKKIATKM